jgi:hypothetical protein
MSYPLEVQLEVTETKEVVRAIPFDVDEICGIIHYYEELTADSQYIIYQIAGPIIDMLYYQETLVEFYMMDDEWEPILGEYEEVKEDNEELTLIQYLIDESAPDRPRYVLRRPIAETIRIVTTTLPRDPEQDPELHQPGIFLGSAYQF